MANLSSSVVVAAVILGLINFLYALPFISQSNLRSVAGLKIFIIAFVWAGTTVLLPVIASHEISGDFILEFIQRFLFVLVLMLPFEIRDLNFDTPELGTIPQIIGIKKTRYAGLMLLFIIVVLQVLKTDSTYTHGLILLLMAMLTLMILMSTEVNQGKYFASFWVEGIPIYWWLTLLFFG